MPLINTSNVTYFHETFVECLSLTTLPLIDTKKGTDFEWFANHCRSLVSVPALDFSAAEKMQYAFATCTSLVTFEPTSFPEATDFSYVFYASPNVSLPGFDLPKATTLEGAFTYTSGFTRTNYSLLLNNLATNNAANNLTLSVGASQYDSSAIQYRTTLLGRGWTINDGGRYRQTITAPITINKAKVGETSTTKLIQYDLAKMPGTWWYNLNDSAEIRVKNKKGQLLKRYVENVDTATRTGQISFIGSVSTAENTDYYITVLPGNVTLNDNTVFGDDNYYVRYNLGDAESPLSDALTIKNLTNYGADLAQDGVFGKSVLTGEPDHYLEAAAFTGRANATKWTQSVWLKPASLSTTQFMTFDAGSWEFVTSISSAGYLQIYINASVNAYTRNDLPSYGVSVGHWFNLALVYDGTLTGSENRLKAYINGVLVPILDFTGSVPATLSASQGVFRLGYTDTRSFAGNIDEVGQISAAKSAGWVTTAYNMIADNAFVTTGTLMYGDYKKSASSGGGGCYKNDAYKNMTKRAYKLKAYK
jgi:hypothetical protein